MNFEGRVMCVSFLRGESEEEINVKFGCQKKMLSKKVKEMTIITKI